ncbi:MAG: YidC/Oxa1 family membrane protein insertase [Patescibacteria group bacterium]|nr:YidC/Oxa1 family membrane protein insertase [Patescibacteria group bacterium]MDD5121083.1 YidC/Oxa1 family membrane protein insertase [Patescibacteria group bacterium]MDD5221987.1 YidC/Oxa1 family membrane protein insertase [Patescibacteria group bacterium]MDD5395998.1 YidC/Oxa1 family membrane protein insertase [Patescibacteria group bacterium]
MIQIYKTVLYQPLLNLLVFLHNILPGHDLGLAIIIVTIIIRLILWPLSQKSVRSQKALQDLQPKLKSLQEKYKQDKQKLAAAMMELYRENKINPFSSFLPLLIQFPILIAVYQVFLNGLKSTQLVLYSFIHNPGALNNVAFGFLNLSKPNLILAVITGAIQYWQTKMLVKSTPPAAVAGKTGAKDEGVMAIMNKQMSVMMPLLTVFIGIALPSGLMIYWLVGLLLTVLQQKLVFKQSTNAQSTSNTTPNK